VRGNRLPAVISWLLTVGWETVLTITAHARHRHRLRTPRLGLGRPGAGGGAGGRRRVDRVGGRARLRRHHAAADA
jgi:hypothetical protein